MTRHRRRDLLRHSGLRLALVAALVFWTLLFLSIRAWASTDPRVAAVAQGWANHLAATGQPAHNPHLWSQLDAAVGQTDEVAENVGWCSCSDVGVVIAGWHASPTHAANLAKTWDVQGLATATAADGTLWVVEDFANLAPPPAPTYTFPTTTDASSAAEAPSQPRTTRPVDPQITYGYTSPPVVVTLPHATATAQRVAAVLDALHLTT